MTTRARTSASHRGRRPRIYRESRPGTLRVTIVQGRTEREVGPRGLLTVVEAAAFLRRSPAAVERSIAAGFLPARRRGGEVVVTLAACDRYLREEAEDAAAIRARRGQRRVPGEDAHAALGL